MERLIRMVAGTLPFALIALAGCQDAGPKLAPVSGVVTYRGKRVSGAVVNFYGEGNPRVATGKTDEQGQFVLTTFRDGDGATVGVNKASVAMPFVPPPSSGDGNSVEPDDRKGREMILAGQHMNRRLQAARNQRQPFPKHYTNPELSGLIFDVQPGTENQFELKLND